MSREYIQHQKTKTYIKACTNGPLTYIRTLKNASSFFYNSFTKGFRWWSIDWCDIQWHETHVFSHIQDPIERRHKGILEYVIMTGCTDLLREDKNFQQLIRTVPCLDAHTASLFDMYGSWCHSIDWIPIYPDPELTISITERLLQVYGQHLFPWDYAAARPASEQMKEMAQLLRDLWPGSDLHHLPGHTQAYLSRDIDLYDRVKRRFNPNGDTWQRSSWLRQD